MSVRHKVQGSSLNSGKERGVYLVEWKMFECEYFRVQLKDMMIYERAYPGLNVTLELHQMVSWLNANPERLKKKYGRFINNWLAKSHRDLEKEKRNGQRESFSERRSRTSAEAIQDIFGGDDGMARKVHGTLPPADK